VKDITEEFAEGIKVDWRAANPYIVGFWYSLEKAAKAAIRSGVGHAGLIHFTYEKEFLRMHLPSGRMLHFYKPEITKDPKFGREAITFIKEIGPTDFPIKGSVVKVPGHKSFGRIFTSPGKLAENATQAAARDVLVHAMKLLPKETVNMHIHDEMVSDGTPLQVLKDAMLVVPEWAEGLPIDVDGWSGSRYRK